MRAWMELAQAWKKRAIWLLGWLGQWGAMTGLIQTGMGVSSAFAAASALGLWHLRPSSENSLALKAILAGTFPLSYVAMRAMIGAPSWIWLIAAAALAWIFPLRDQKDAPLWRSPKQIGLALAAMLPEPPKSVMDPGCGLGDALLQMKEAWPGVRLVGVEKSMPARWVAQWRLGRQAQIEQGDMWEQSWSGVEMVYLFLRPEAMRDAWTKCQSELESGAWVASLEFEIPGARVRDEQRLSNGMALRLYQIEKNAR